MNLPRPRLLTWNFGSAIIGPLVVLTVVIGLFLPRVLQHGHPLYAVPFAYLTVTAVIVLEFWLLRLACLHRPSLRTWMPAAGRSLYLLGLLCTVGLAVTASAKLVNYFLPLGVIFLFETDRVYWVFTVAGLIDGTHHFIYKLVYGRKDAIFEMSRGTGRFDWRKAAGGAIGIQLRKMSRRAVAGGDPKGR